MVDFKGLATALVTPFVDGEVDWQAFRNLVRRQVEAGVDFLVPLGSTAETPCLTDAEKVKILEIAREESNGLPIVAGAGSNSLTATVRNMRLLDGHGADAYLIVVPFYNKPTQEGLYQYFKAVAEETDRQVILYNVPGRTGTNMKTETTLRLAEIPNITAVKEASGNLAQIIDIKRQAPEGFAVLSGNDDQTFPVMKAGGDGVISVASNIAPVQMVALTEAMMEGRIEVAEDLDKRLSPLFHSCFVESNPIPVKAGLNLVGLCSGEMRLPLTEAVLSTVEAMRKAIEGLEI